MTKFLIEYDNGEWKIIKADRLFFTEGKIVFATDDFMQSEPLSRIDHVEIQEDGEKPLTLGERVEKLERDCVDAKDVEMIVRSIIGWGK